MTIEEKILFVTTKSCKTIISHQKKSTWNKEVPDSEEDIEDILGKLTQLSKLKEDFIKRMPGWIETRQRTINELNEIADECDNLHKGCNIANVTGSSVGAVGSIMAIGGIILVPFTFGGSLALTVAGAATGMAGAAANVTTSIVESSKMKDKSNTAQDCLDKDKHETDQLNNIVESLMAFLNSIESLQEKLQSLNNLESVSIAVDGGAIATKAALSAMGITKSAKALQIIRSFTAAEISVLKECPKLMKSLKVFKGTALAAGKLATCLAVAGLGISIYEIITTSRDIHGGSETEAGKRFRENAKSLAEQRDTLCEIQRKLMLQ